MQENRRLVTFSQEDFYEATFTLIHRELWHPKEHRPAVPGGQHGVDRADPPLPYYFFRTALTTRAQPSLNPDTM